MTPEDQLRTLLQQAEKKNKALSEDYIKLQKQNVELLTRLEKVEKEKKKFRKTVSYTTLEHSYHLPQ